MTIYDGKHKRCIVCAKKAMRDGLLDENLCEPCNDALVKAYRFADVSAVAWIARRVRAHERKRPRPIDASVYAQKCIGSDLRKARESARLTQSQLAKRIKRSQALVARAELGNIPISSVYFGKVLDACGLPPDWKP